MYCNDFHFKFLLEGKNIDTVYNSSSALQYNLISCHCPRTILSLMCGAEGQLFSRLNKIKYFEIKLSQQMSQGMDLCGEHQRRQVTLSCLLWH